MTRIFLDYSSCNLWFVVDVNSGQVVKSTFGRLCSLTINGAYHLQIHEAGWYGCFAELERYLEEAS